MLYSNRDYAIIDVETSRIRHGEIPKTKFWGYADSHGYKKFDNTKDLLKFLGKLSPKTILHHTNFDIIQLLVDGANVGILKSHNTRLIKSKLGEHILINSYSCFPVSLGSVFMAFGYKKTELGKLDKRNYDDCVLGLECFIKLDSIFHDLAGVSPLAKGTIASTGFAAAESVAGRMPKDLRFLDAYRGGRVEVFDTRNSQAGKYDICSSYPTSFVDCPAQSNLLLVKVKSHDWYGPLFDRNVDDMLLFPNGKFTSYVYSDVWERYIEPSAPNTEIKIIRKTKIDFAWLNELKNFVRTIYAKKQQSTGGIKLVCKLLLNSLYGRIGLKGESERCRVLNYRPDGDDIEVHYLGRKRWIAFDKVLREPHSNYPFAAYITDNARGRLYSAFVNNDALYGDTDSVFTRLSKGKFAGTQGDDLGQWQFEGREQFKANNVKDYTFGDKVVLKGGEGFMMWTLKQFSKGKTVQSVLRTRQSHLRKRVVLPDGTTSPLIVR